MCLPLCQEMAVLFIKRIRRTVRWTAIGYYFLSQQGCVMRHSCYSGTNIINKKKEKKTLKDLCSLTAGWMKHADAALLSGPYSRMIIYQLCVKFLWCFLRWMTWTKNDCWAFTTRKSRRVPILNWGYVWDCFCTYCRYKAECSQGNKYFKYKDYHWQSQPFNVCSEGCQQDFLNSRCPLWHSLDGNYTSTACHQELKLRAFFFFLSLTLSITHKCIMSNITEWQTLKATWAWCDSW